MEKLQKWVQKATNWQIVSAGGEILMFSPQIPGSRSVSWRPPENGVFYRGLIERWDFGGKSVAVTTTCGLSGDTQGQHPESLFFY